MEGKCFDLQGKVAIVTGAGAEAGIGFHIAKVLAEAGAKVVLTGRREPELAELTGRLTAKGLAAAYKLVEMSDEKSIEDMVKFTVDTFGRLDILANNAASTADPRDACVGDLDVAVWDSIFAVNVRGTMLASKYAIREMLKVGGGSIINMSSGTALAGDYQYTSYGCTKGAMNTLTKFIATQYGRQGIRCNALIIGLVRTGGKAQDHLPKELLKIFADNHLVGRLGEPEEIGYFTQFLASDQAAWITGQLLHIDGGYFAQLPTTQPIANWKADVAAKQGS